MGLRTKVAANIPDKIAGRQAKSASGVAAVDQVPPPGKLLVFAIQHVLVLYAGAIAVPILIAGVAGLSDRETGILISADLFAGGIASILQSAGLWKIGIRLPLMMGVTFAAVPPMMVMVGDSGIGLTGMFGSVIAAGVFTLLMAPVVGRMIKLFPPVVTGTVITVTGLSLIPVGINWLASGQEGEGAALNILISFVVLMSIVLIMKYGRGFFRSISILLGIVIGFVLSAALGKVDFSGVGGTPWFEFIAPFHFGMPEFHLPSIIALSIVMIVVMVETTGMMLTMGVMVERKLTDDDIVRGLRVDGVGTILGGIFNTFPYVTFSQNIGLVGVTNVKSRWVCVMAGVIMICLALFPKLSLTFALIPQFVLGGAGLVMFGMVVATGISLLADVNFKDEVGRNNLFIISVSASVGMIPTVDPELFAVLPHWMNPITHSGIVLSAIAAVLLNLFFNGVNGEGAHQNSASS